LDDIADAGATAIAFLDKIARLSAALRMAARRAGDESAEDLEPRFPELVRVVSRLTELREMLDKIRAGRPVVREIVDTVGQATRSIEQDLERVDSRLQQLQQNSSQRRIALEEARTSTIPRWINCGAIVASALIVWMGLGQFALMRGARRSSHGAEVP
jgi:methyl-accepting chemotaxis protein